MTDQEIMQSAKRHADGWRVTLDMDRESLCNEQQMAYDLLAAAERIRVLGEEVEKGRAWMAAKGRLDNLPEKSQQYNNQWIEVFEAKTMYNVARAATDAARRG